VSDPNSGGEDTAPTTVRDVETLGWTTGTFAHGAAFADLPGALLVLWGLARMASRAAKIGLIADLWGRRRSWLAPPP
jgi:hypothetical protein